MSINWKLVHRIVKIVMPFGSRVEIMFVASMCAISYLYFINESMELAYIVTFGGYFGACCVGFMTRQKTMEIDSAVAQIVIERIERAKYIFDKDNSTWTPPLPKWLMWNRTFIHLEYIGDKITISGPSNMVNFFINKGLFPA